MSKVLLAIVVLIILVVAAYYATKLKSPQASADPCQAQSDYKKILVGDWVATKIVSLKDNAVIPIDGAAVPSFRIQPDPQYQGVLTIWKGVNKSGYAPMLPINVYCDGSIPEATSDGVYKVKVNISNGVLILTDNTDGGRQFFLAKA